MSNNCIKTICFCKNCNKKYEFSDNSTKAGIREYKCKHFELKLIRNTNDDNLKYYLSLKCTKCSKKQKNNLKIITEYEQIKQKSNYNYFNCCENYINVVALLEKHKNSVSQDDNCNKLKNNNLNKNNNNSSNENNFKNNQPNFNAPNNNINSQSINQNININNNLNFNNTFANKQNISMLNNDFFNAINNFNKKDDFYVISGNNRMIYQMSNINSFGFK
jgi:hypothetical protein